MLLHCIEGHLGVVVVTAQMAKPDISQVGGEIVGDELRGLTVAQVSCSGGDSAFKVNRITSVLEHLLVVVALNHQVIGFVYIIGHLLGDGPHICCQRHPLSVELEEISGIVITVVRYIEWCYT